VSKASGEIFAAPAAARAVWNNKGLWLLHVVGNGILLALIYEWLWIPDRTVTHLVISALTGLAIIGLALLLHGGTLAHFRALHSGGPSSWVSAFGFSLSRLTAFALWTLILVVALGFVFWMGGYEERVANWLSSFLTFRLRRPVTPAAVAWTFSWIIMIASVVVLPALLLPAGSQAAREGFSGLSWSGIKRSLRLPRRLRYWGAYAALLLAGVVLPYVLVWWIPEVGGFYAETTSLVARFLAAYLLAVTSWLVLVSLVGQEAR
jgi:hypothetical protein